MTPPIPSPQPERSKSKTKRKKPKKMEAHPPSPSSAVLDVAQTSEASQEGSQNSQEGDEASALLLQQHVQGMSTHDLINNPCTLQAGLSLLNGHILAALNPVVAKDGKGDDLPSTSTSDSNSTVKARSKVRRKRIVDTVVEPPSSPVTSCTTDAAEIQPPLLPEDKDGAGEEEDIPGDLIQDRNRLVRSSSPCSSIGSWCSTNSTTSGSSCSSGFVNEVDKKRGEKGVAQFGELCRRFKLPDANMSPSKKIEEFDLEKSNDIFLRSVFADYDKKERMYKQHTKKIEDLDVTTALEHFERIKVSILDIFEGRALSQRMEMYVSDNKDDLSALKGMCVSAPFLNPIYMYIAKQITDYLLPRKRSKQKYLEAVQLVLIPETLIRIYGSVNGIEYTHAEKEMRFGPQYDGPAPKKRRGLKPSNGNRRKRTKTAQPERKTTTEIEPASNSCNSLEDAPSSTASGSENADQVDVSRLM